MAAKKKKKYELIRIISLDGSQVFRDSKPSTFKDGKLNKELFSGVLDESLDKKELFRVYRKHSNEIPYPCVTEDGFCRAIVNVSFNYTVGDMTVAEIREGLYREGFEIDGVRYMRYKRSAGASRDGRCLFVAEPLYEDMMKWSSLDLSGEGVSDQASWQAYIALTLSSVESYITLPKKAFLIIPDKSNVFKEKSVCVKKDDAEGLVATEEETEIENVIWDGEALLDVSEFKSAGLADKGMMLLRNRFFKTCAFNTNLQKWFRDNGITEIRQLAGYTTARKIEDIKIVVTESSVKYLKFMPKGMKLGEAFKRWLDAVYEGSLTSTFGVVKTDKPPFYMEGAMTYTNYQLLNTIPIARENMQRFIDRSFFELSRIQHDSMFLCYQINYLSSTKLKDLETVDAENYRRKVVMDMLFKTPEFENTDFYSSLRGDVVKHFKRRMKRGRILINGNYETLFGNPYEFLVATIDKSYQPTKPMLLGDGEVYTKRFDDGEELLGARNPHITMGNLFLARNKKCGEIDEYFNLTDDIVCVNAIGSNIQQRLNGCDYDSDTMLVTNDEILIDGVKICYDNLCVPVCKVDPVGKAEYSSSSVDLARLDRAIAENEIGNIINLSQFLNCLFWHRLMEGEYLDDLKPLYREICKLAVLSGMEIDKAKRLYDVDKYSVLRKLTRYRNEFKEEHGDLPNFYYFIIGNEDKIHADNTANLNTPMAYIYDSVEAYNAISTRIKRVPLVSLFDLDITEKDTNDSHRKAAIIEAVTKAHKELKHKKIKERDDEDTKRITRIERGEIFSECLNTVAKNIKNDHTLYLLLNEIDKAKDRDVTGAKSLLFACILYEKNGRLISKIKTPEDYHCVELKRYTGTKEDMEKYFFEDVYGYPHHVIVDEKCISKTIKLLLVGDGCYFVDINGTPVPKKFFKI